MSRTCLAQALTSLRHKSNGNWCALAIFLWLLDSVQVACQQVQWHISNAWKDDDCDGICNLQGFKCTEDCWPASIAGLQAAVNSPHLKGVCYDVVPGNPEQFHPAKDAENTLCYWNPGAVTQLRCPVVSVTSSQAMATGLVTRRLCPCVNHSTSVISDCGIGGAPALPRFGGSPAPNSGTSGSSASPSPNATSAPPASPAPPSPTQGLATQYVAVPQACNLCVLGFGGVDQILNGEYQRVSSGSSTSWRQGNYMLLVGSNNYWQFQERQMDGTFIPISQGSLVATTSSLTPQSEFFTTSLGGWTVHFSSSCQSRCGATSANTGTKPDDSGVGAGAVVLIIIAILVVLGCIPAAVYAIVFRKSLALRLSKPGSETQKTPWESPVTSPKNMKIPSLADPELGSSGFPSGQKSPSETLRQTAASGNSMNMSAQHLHPRSTGSDFSFSMNASASSTQGPPADTGIYEGPVNPWWGAGNAQSVPTRWQPGCQVRLCGFGPKSSLNGVIGTVDKFNENGGLVHVKLSDGKLKAVKPENCEDLDATPKRPDGWRGKAKSLFDSMMNEPHGGNENAHGRWKNSSSSSEPSAKRSSDSGAGVASLLSSPSSQDQARRQASRTLQTDRVARSSLEVPPPLPPPASPPESPSDRRVAVGGIRNRSHSPVAPAAKAMALAPSNALSGGIKGAMSKPSAPGAMKRVSIAEAEPAPRGLMDDLMLAQKRNEAKLNAMKVRLGAR